MSLDIEIRYVAHHGIEQALRDGWEIVTEGPVVHHHDLHSIQMRRTFQEDRLSALSRFRRAVEDCAAARDDEAAFDLAIKTLGLVCWNCSHELEAALSR